MNKYRCLLDSPIHAIWWKLYLGMFPMISPRKVYRNTSGQNDLSSVASAYVVAIKSAAGEISH